MVLRERREFSRIQFSKMQGEFLTADGTGINADYRADNMENSGIPKRRWTLTRWAQVLSTAFIFLVTCAYIALDALQISLPRTDSSYTIFFFGLLIMGPAAKLTRLIGIYETVGFWGYSLIELVLNTAVTFCLVGFLGRMVSRVKNKLRKQQGHDRQSTLYEYGSIMWSDGWREGK